MSFTFKAAILSHYKQGDFMMKSASSATAAGASSYK